MNRRTKRWLSILLLGALAFSQATLVLAACAMDRGGLAPMLSTAPDHDCCDEDTMPQSGDSMPMSASVCANHTISDLQAFNAFPVAITAKAVAAWYTHELPSRFAPQPAIAPPKPVPSRILLHSFQV